MSLREEKKARTRQALIDAGWRLFVEQGFDKTSVDEVAAAAGIARRTLFRYFPSKEAIFFAPQEARLEQFEALLQQAPTDAPPFVVIEEAMLEIARLYMNDRTHMLTQRRAIEASQTLMAYDLQMDRTWEDVIATALQGTDNHPKAIRRARLLAGAMVGMVRVVLRDWFRNEGREDLLKLGREAIDELVQGFGLAWPDKPKAEQAASWKHLMS